MAVIGGLFGGGRTGRKADLIGEQRGVPPFDNHIGERKSSADVSALIQIKEVDVHIG
jgi:hypothetical protein